MLLINKEKRGKRVHEKRKRYDKGLHGTLLLGKREFTRCLLAVEKEVEEAKEAEEMKKRRKKRRGGVEEKEREKEKEEKDERSSRQTQPYTSRLLSQKLLRPY